MTDEAVLPAPLGVALDAAELEPSRRLAWAALLDVTPASQLGELVALVAEEDEGVYTLQYTTRLPGYPDWRWNVSLVRLVDQAEPTVLEVELLPGDGALLAPSWVPWSDRLADYEAAQLLEAGEVVDGAGESGAPADEETAPKSSKRIRRTRTRRRIGADGVPEAAANGAEEAEGGSSEAPSADLDESDATKPKKKKRKKEKSGKKAKGESHAGGDAGVTDDAPAADKADDDAAAAEGDAEAKKKPKKSRRKRTEQAAPEQGAPEQQAAAESVSDQAAETRDPSAGEDGEQKPARRKRKKKGAPAAEDSEASAQQAAPGESAPRPATDDKAPDQAKAKTRGKRRRVVVVPRSEDELPEPEPAEFGEAADIREFADDMDDVFDGVDFESDTDTGTDAETTDAKQ
ncbi:DUF3027 domain-containing protein [Pseudoclavibacter helvolus]|uniref:DUF3027 domain-containing protein n=1 Tax=Pseudoclavibacter helvolus TaxID=255205 RepID=UPI003C77635A